MTIEQLAAALVEAMKGMDSLADADGADPRYSPAFMALEDALAIGGQIVHETVRVGIGERTGGSMTIGEQRVRVKFNPSLSDDVDRIKQRTAELINLCETFKGKDPRLAALAQTAYEEAAMWAVKAATAQEAR